MFKSGKEKETKRTESGNRTSQLIDTGLLTFAKWNVSTSLGPVCVIAVIEVSDYWRLPEPARPPLRYRWRPWSAKWDDCSHLLHSPIQLRKSLSVSAFWFFVKTLPAEQCDITVQSINKGRKRGKNTQLLQIWLLLRVWLLLHNTRWSFKILDQLFIRWLSPTPSRYLWTSKAHSQELCLKWRLCHICLCKQFVPGFRYYYIYYFLRGV